MLAVEDLTTHPLLESAVERGLEPFCHQAFANVFHRFRAAVEGVGDLGVDPVGAVRIRLEQHLGTTHLLRRHMALLGKTVQNIPLRIGQANNILLVHGPILLGGAIMTKIAR